MPEDIDFIEASSIGNQMDFNGVLYLQINRVMKSMSSNNPDYTYAIEALEGLLSWLEDDRFKTDMEELVKDIKNAKKEYAKQRGLKNLGDDDEEVIAFLAIKEKLKALMRLALRSNLLPERVIEDNIGD